MSEFRRLIIHNKLYNSNRVWGWGLNDNGQLGSGITNRNTPTPTHSQRQFQSVSAGWNHSFAIDIDGYLWAWGNSQHGQLGTGDKTTYPIPVQVGTKKWKQVVGGDNHSLGIDIYGVLWAWGQNDSGQLGNGVAHGADCDTPLQIGTKTWQSVAAGDSVSYGIDSDGYLWGWGDNQRSQLGLPDLVEHPTPTRLSDKKFKAVSAWTAAYCIDTKGYLFYVPEIIVNNPVGAGVQSVSVGGDNILTIDTDGYLHAKGVTNRDKKFQAVSAGGNHSLAIDIDGYLWAWGNNLYGQLGTGDNANSSTLLQIGTKKWKSVAAGYGHSLAINI